MTKDLIEGAYYYTENGIEKAHYCEVNGVRELVTPKAKVIDPVPSYKKWQELKSHDEKATIKLGEKCIENLQLKELLRECLNEIHELAEIQDNRSVTIYNFLSAELITKIDNAIGEKK